MASNPCRVTLTTPAHLVTASFVRSLRGISAEAIFAEVEAGKIRFAWHVGIGKHNQALRFWLPEFAEPEVARRLSLREAIALMLGEHRSQWRGTEVARMLLVSRPQIVRLRRCRALAGRVLGNTLWVQRPQLEQFLIKRSVSSLA